MQFLRRCQLHSLVRATQVQSLLMLIFLHFPCLHTPPPFCLPLPGVRTAPVECDGTAGFVVGLQKNSTLLDLCVSSLRRGHADLLCIVPILTDDPRRESSSVNDVYIMHELFDFGRKGSRSAGGGGEWRAMAYLPMCADHYTTADQGVISNFNLLLAATPRRMHQMSSDF